MVARFALAGDDWSGWTSGASTHHRTTPPRHAADADVPRDEDACRRLDRAFQAWSASFGHGGGLRGASKIAERCIDLAFDENVATSNGGAAAARRCVESALAALADAGGVIDAGALASRDAKRRRCISPAGAAAAHVRFEEGGYSELLPGEGFAATLQGESEGVDRKRGSRLCAGRAARRFGGDPPLGAHATLYAPLCAVAALHATCGDAAGATHDAVANAAEALRKRVVSLDATAARNAEFLDTLIATPSADARSRPGLSSLSTRRSSRTPPEAARRRPPPSNLSCLP